jgi:DNA repair protein RadC
MKRKLPEYKKLDASFDLRIGVNPSKPAGAAKVSSSAEVYELTKDYSKADREIMLVIMVDSKNAVLSIETHSIGCIDSSAVYPREIFRSLLLKNASSFILVHNHPSGDPTPSFMDKQITEDIVKGAMILGVKLLDHVILGDGRYYSMADSGELDSFVLANGVIPFRAQT